MIAIELLVLAVMAVALAASFVGSARSHTRARAWSAPAVHSMVATTSGTLIDASDRFVSRTEPLAA